MAQRVLIVDDERSIRLTLTQTITGMGLAAGAADTGESALEQLAGSAWDLVLLDLRLPGIDGLEVLRRAMEGQPRPRIIIITAHGTIDNAVEALKLGAIDFIQKPFTPDGIRELVRRVLARGQLDEQATGYDAALELAKQALSERAWEAADQHLRRAIQAAPNRPEAFNLLGMVKELLGEHREALSNYRAALDFDPTYQPARTNLERATQRRNPGPNLREL